MFLTQLPSPIQQLSSGFLDRFGVSLSVKRDDLIHHAVSGNKWRKLKYNIQAAIQNEKPCILTFGGAFSNHIAATAAACRLNGIESIGLIRGEELNPSSNSTLEDAQNQGMKLHFLSRQAYRKKDMPDFQAELKEVYGDFQLVPEGGANEMGVRGCEEILAETNKLFDVVACSAGTATTAAGILRSVRQTQVYVFPALKGGEDLAKRIQFWQTDENKMDLLQLFTQYHFGGYATVNQHLVDFANQFYQVYHIPLDLIYTAKLFYGLFDLIGKGHFPKGSEILLLHSGGLQGNQGVLERSAYSLNYV